MEFFEKNYKKLIIIIFVLGILFRSIYVIKSPLKDWNIRNVFSNIQSLNELVVITFELFIRFGFSFVLSISNSI